MNAEETTPRPWLAHGCVIESASRCVTVTRGGIARADWQDDCADARLIVRAVNAHDAMRDALERIAHGMGAADEEPEPDFDDAAGAEDHGYDTALFQAAEVARLALRIIADQETQT